MFNNVIFEVYTRVKSSPFYRKPNIDGRITAIIVTI